MAAASRNPIPRELKDKIPPLMFTLVVEMRTFGIIFGLALALFSLYGPIIGPSNHNGFRYLLGPWVCPWLLALYYRFFPYHPYRGSTLFVGELVDLDKRDVDAKRLDELFQSAEARHMLVRTTLKMSVIIFVVMALVTATVHDSLNWSLSSAWQDPGLLVGAIAASIAVGVEYLSWGISRWAASYNINVSE